MKNKKTPVMLNYKDLTEKEFENQFFEIRNKYFHVKHIKFQNDIDKLFLVTKDDIINATNAFEVYESNLKNSNLKSKKPKKNKIASIVDCIMKFYRPSKYDLPNFDTKYAIKRTSNTIIIDLNEKSLNKAFEKIIK
ncbi:MAG: hypothetical protein A2046_08050 [Bacteroidetes bacterium GWA2_30_7]|nr:MAG: hypothetical protein A2046_08050 [Bacteroidetes bacterium GWA2_30_7]